MTPPSAARPGCRRFTMPPPDFENSRMPEQSEPAMPSAFVMRSASRPISRPAVIAPPNVPKSPGA